MAQSRSDNAFTAAILAGGLTGLLKVADLADDVRIEEIGPEELATYDPDGLMFVNVNTPHDYERAKKLLALSRRSPEGAKGDRITNVQRERARSTPLTSPLT